MDSRLSDDDDYDEDMCCSPFCEGDCDSCRQHRFMARSRAAGRARRMQLDEQTQGRIAEERREAKRLAPYILKTKVRFVYVLSKVGLPNLLINQIFNLVDDFSGNAIKYRQQEEIRLATAPLDLLNMRIVYPKNNKNYKNNKNNKNRRR